MFDNPTFLGGNEPGDPSDLPNLHDGKAHHHGPAEAGRGEHGGEDHQSHHLLQKLSAQHAGVRVPQGCGHGHARRYVYLV